MSFNRNKALPELPLDCTNGFEEMLALSSPSAESASSNSKALPAIRIEETLSTEEMDHLRDRWNRSSKGTSMHSKRQLGQHMKFPPPPITLPKATENILASALSAPTRAAPESRSWKLWHMLRGRNTPTSPSGQKARQSFRSKSQFNLRKKMKNAVSTPEISGHPNVVATTAAKVPQVSTSPQAVATGISMEESRALTQEELVTNDGGIYLTIDSDWRNSRGEAMLTFLTPIPQDHDPLRPDSPILHRHRSLCDLATLVRMQEPEFEATASPRVHPIDELHSFIMMLD